MDSIVKENIKRKIIKRFNSSCEFGWTISSIDVFSMSSFVHLFFSKNYLTDVECEYFITLKTLLNALSFEVRVLDLHKDFHKLRVTYCINNSEIEKNF